VYVYVPCPLYITAMSCVDRSLANKLFGCSEKRVQREKKSFMLTCRICTDYSRNISDLQELKGGGT
jgi:hypothetical protein